MGSILSSGEVREILNCFVTTLLTPKRQTSLMRVTYPLNQLVADRKKNQRDLQHSRACKTWTKLFAHQKLNPTFPCFH
jgi:glycogen synthase